MSPLLRTVRRIGRGSTEPPAVARGDVQRSGRRSRQFFPYSAGRGRPTRAGDRTNAFSREEFAKACKLDPGATSFERARRFYVRARQVRTGLAQTATVGRWANCKNTSRAGMSGVVSRWLGGVGDLQSIAERLLRVQIENRPAIQIIHLYDSPGTLFYCDPPYIHDTRGDSKAYGHEMSDEQHVELARVLNHVRGMDAISNYPCELMNKLYPAPKWHKTVTAARTNHATKGKRIESLWTNYDPSLALEKQNGNGNLF